MDATSIAQLANPFIQTVFIMVMGLGYYFTIRNLRSQVQEMNQARTTGGRPLIIVTEDYENLPTINLIVQNVGYGPAKNISFEFSSAVESSDGFVLSDLAFFKEGITSLAPGGRIVCYWDELQNLQNMFEEGRFERGIEGTVNYQDITGGSFSHDWEIDPMLYQGLRTIVYRGLSDLVDIVEEISEEGVGGTIKYKVSREPYPRSQRKEARIFDLITQ
jgi:hypothetical protein